MEDVIAVTFRHKDGEGAAMGWGRLFHPIDSTELLELVKIILESRGRQNVAELHLCDSLREVTDFQYFYEGLLAFAEQLAHAPVRDAKWKKKQRSLEEFGRTLYLLGERCTDE